MPFNQILGFVESMGRNLCSSDLAEERRGGLLLLGHCAFAWGSPFWPAVWDVLVDGLHDETLGVCDAACDALFNSSVILDLLSEYTPKVLLIFPVSCGYIDTGVTH